MKLKVLKVFNDKYTGQLYKINDVIEVNEERAKEILNHPLELVEEVVEELEAAKEDEEINQIVEEFKAERAAQEKKKTTRKKKAQ